MSTRATYEFQDAYGSYTVYKHHDGYPKGGLQWIAKAIPFAWDMPRFEADDFAAAFVAGNKHPIGGDVRLTKGKDAHGDTAYHYVVTCRAGVLHVDITTGQSWEPVASGALDELLDKYAPDREWINATGDGVLAALKRLVALNNCNYDRGTDDYRQAMSAANNAIAAATEHR